MVLVFKTSVATVEEVLTIKPNLDQLLAGSKWNFDLEDCDHILRIETSKNISSLVIETLTELGYFCGELD